MVLDVEEENEDVKGDDGARGPGSEIGVTVLVPHIQTCSLRVSRHTLPPRPAPLAVTLTSKKQLSRSGRSGVRFCVSHSCVIGSCLMVVSVSNGCVCVCDSACLPSIPLSPPQPPLGVKL